MKFYFLTLGTILVVCVGCQIDGQQMVERGDYVAPPASQMAHPGPMVDRASPGIMPMMAPPPQRSFQSQTSQIRMTSPVGMSVGWQAGPGYAENQLTTGFVPDLANLSSSSNDGWLPVAQQYSC
jgi:hypothetical protein